LQLKVQPTLAVFGGSFNPVHEGHLGIVRALACDAEVQAVIVVPARRSPFKHDAPPLPDGVRWELLRRALRGLPRVLLSDVELRRPAPSYTVDTLRTLASLLPGARLLFALGWDAFAEFAGWSRAAEVLALAGLIVFDRAGAGRSAAADAEACRTLLPPPWPGQAQARDTRTLVAPDGRVLLRHWPLALPQVAAREVLRTRTLEGVPPGAREALADYWARTPEA
jgi:nicotinate (nicotinamide) nucleotide adenylyltransferase